MRLSDIFSKGMILQANKPIKVFGTGIGEGRIEFLGKVTEFTSNDIEWCVTLGTYKYGGPYEMKVTLNGDSVIISDIFMGEVWIAGGQSNMGLHLCETVNGLLGLKISKDNDAIRYFVPYCDEPGYGDIYTGEWAPVDEGCVSAVGYYTAKCLHQMLGVHIGIIDCCKGFTSSFHWIPRSEINKNTLTSLLAKSKDDILSGKCTEKEALCHIMGYSYGLPYGYFFDNQLKAICPYQVQGALWYQGETDASDELSAKIYKTSFEMVVKSWRKYLENDNMLFITTLLANYGDENIENPKAWAYMRQVQIENAQDLENICYINAVDRGTANNIHPNEKRCIGERMAACALNKVYGMDIPWKSPTLKDIEYTEDKLIITFNDTYGKLFEDCGVYNDFEVCTKDGEMKRITGKVADEHVELEADNAVSVSYAYENNPYIRIYNKYGLPLVPFYKEL